MKQTIRAPESRVGALWQRVAVHFTLAGAAGVLGGLGILLVASWALGRSAVWQRPSPVPLILWLLTAAILVLWLWRVTRRLIGWNRRAAAAEIERRKNWPRGVLQGAVEPGLERPGTSRALIAAHKLWLARQLQATRSGELGSGVARAARMYVAVALIVGISAWAVSGIIWTGARDAAAASWVDVLHPLKHLSAPPLPPLQLHAEAVRVRRGRDLDVGVSALLRDSVQLVWRSKGEVAERRWFPVVDGHADARVPRVHAATLYWATDAAGAVSDTLQVVPVDPLLMLDLQVELRYPQHTGRGREVISTPLPLMSVTQGTRATITGKTTRAISQAILRSETGRDITFRIDNRRRFQSSFTVRTGSWGWDIVGSEGGVLQGEADSVRFVTVPDSAPLVQIVYPGADTVLGVEMTQPLLIDVRDDYGLSKLELVSWRVSVWGETWPESVEPLPLADGGPRAAVTALLDANDRGFLPGDALHYFVRAFDNAPQAQIGKSREYVLRLPTLEEVRDRTVADAKDLLEDAERLAENAKAQEELTRALERSTEVQPPPSSNGRGPRREQAVEFRDTEAARRALEEAGGLLEEAEEIQEALRDLQEAVERAGLNDSSVLERLREIESLYERILTPELQAQIDSLREALVELDAERIREAIRELAEGSVDFRERVEQSVELLKRAALEQEFQTLEAEAEDLVGEQERLAEAAETDPTGSELERRAEDLSERSEELSTKVGEFAEELGEAGEESARQKAEEAESAAAEAAQSNAQVARSSQQRSANSTRAAQRAHSQMQQAADALEAGREEMQSEWREQVTEALRRAQAEALELARRQQSINERLGSVNTTERGSLRSEEVALKRGLNQIEQQLSDASQSSLLVDPSLQAAVGEVETALDRLLEQLADGARRQRVNPGMGEQVSEGLNELAYRLMQAGDAAAGSQSGTGFQEALEQLAQLAQQQGELNAQAGGVDPGDVPGALLQRLQALAARQQRIAQELGALDRSVGPRGQVLGQLDAMANEAEEIAQELQRGRIDPQLIKRQEQLFQRLLDAGRTLEQDEFERQRRAERPTTTEIIRPGALPAELLGGPEFPHPAAEDLRRFSPAFRRLILDYFDRLNGLESAGGP